MLDMRLSHILADLAVKKSDNIVRFPCFYHAWYLIRCTNRPSFLIAITLAWACEQMTMMLLLPFVRLISQRPTLLLKTSCMTLRQMLRQVLLERDLRSQVCYHMCSSQYVEQSRQPRRNMDMVSSLQCCWACYRNWASTSLLTRM